MPPVGDDDESAKNARLPVGRIALLARLRALGPLVWLGAAGLLAVFAYLRGAYATDLAHGNLDVPTVLLVTRFVVTDFLFLGVVLYALWSERRWARGAALGATLLFALVQAVQYRSLVESRSFLTPTLLRMAGLFEDILTPRVLVEAAVVPILGVIGTYFVLRTSGLKSARPGYRIVVAAVAAGGILGAAALPRGSRESRAEKRFGVKAESPVLSFGRAVWSLAAGRDEPPIRLSEADLAFARSCGLEIAPEAVVPLRRPRVWTEPLPFPRAADVPSPNAIVLFVESLSADLLEPYGGGLPGLTPRISEFARAGMRVDGYWNHTTPTVKGLRGQLCSIYPAFGHLDWWNEAAKPRATQLLCVPHILDRMGYETVHLSHAYPDRLHHEAQFADFGYRRTFFRSAVMREFLQGEPFARSFGGVGGEPSDRQMFRALREFLTRRDASRPVFVTVSTIETHLGRDVGTDGVEFGDGTDPRWNSVRNLDSVFGEFWDWFARSPYAGNTVVVLTADHAMPPSEEYRSLLGPRAPRFSIAPVALIVYDPTHSLPGHFDAATSSIDLAPSLLQLLDAANVPNGFAGLSMFSDRGGVRGGLGEDGDAAILFWEGSTPVVGPSPGDACFADGPLADEGACRATRVVRYLQSLERDNQIWRLGGADDR